MSRNDEVLDAMQSLLLQFANAPPHPPCPRRTCVLCARTPGRGDRMYVWLKQVSAELRRRPDFDPSIEVRERARKPPA